MLIPGGEDLLEEGMATHSSTLAWRIPWTEEPGSLQPIGSHHVGHYLAHTRKYLHRWWNYLFSIFEPFLQGPLPIKIDP